MTSSAIPGLCSHPHVTAPRGTDSTPMPSFNSPFPLRCLFHCMSFILPYGCQHTCALSPLPALPPPLPAQTSISPAPAPAAARCLNPNDLRVETCGAGGHGMGERVMESSRLRGDGKRREHRTPPPPAHLCHSVYPKASPPACWYPTSHKHPSQGGGHTDPLNRWRESPPGSPHPSPWLQPRSRALSPRMALCMAPCMALCPCTSACLRLCIYAGVWIRMELRTEIGTSGGRCGHADLCVRMETDPYGGTDMPLLYTRRAMRARTDDKQCI